MVVLGGLVASGSLHFPTLIEDCGKMKRSIDTLYHSISEKLAYRNTSRRIRAGYSGAINMFLSDCLLLQCTTIGGSPHVTSRLTPWATTTLQPNLLDMAPVKVKGAKRHNYQRFHSSVLLSPLLLV
ncbi:hypothetical protein UPYG_G00005800 [Umbra pygmaea]|uniref:Uncharacterized protein n=1 Tax=Umbra pygmaea TaxID=75934 RepID=A0ABD0Y6K1_UMBPY